MDNPDPQAATPPPAAARASAAQHAALVAGLLALVLTRALLVHNDPTDFPLDRNMTSTLRIKSFVDAQARGELGLARFLRSPIETPEYPFLPIGAWVLTWFGAPMIAAGRIVSLVASLLTGIGLFVLGRRLDPPWIGLAALWLFAIDPPAIFLGRSLLPDSIMMAAVVWSFVAAGAGTNDPRRARAVWMAIGLIAAVAAKLPAVMLAPAVALALVGSHGLKNRRGWIVLAVVAAVVYAATCAWYRLAPWNPFAGLRRISENTNNIMVSLGELWSADALRVLVSRLTLALTLPGLALALLGGIAIQSRPGPRLWINAWMLLAILAVGLTLQANTYWAYLAVPSGCLLAAVGLAEIARHGRRAAVAAAAMAIVALALDPAAPRVRHDLATDPRAAEVGELVAQRIVEDGNGSLVTFGSTAGDIQFFTGKRGAMISPDFPFKRQQEAARRADYLLARDMLGHPLLNELFLTQSVIATRDRTFALFGLQRRHAPGRPEQGRDASRSFDLSLGPALTLLDCRATTPAMTADGELELAVVWQRGMADASTPFVALDCVHAANGEAFPLAPTEGGAVFKLWSMPQIQIPEFKGFPVAAMTYRFAATGLPDGDYNVRLRRLADRGRTLIEGDPVVVPGVFSVHRPAAASPHRFDLDNAVWLQPARLNEADWLGRRRTLHKLGADGRLWLNAPLPAGRYTLAITARALPVGDDPEERWPRILVTQANTRMGDTAPLTFDGSGGWTRTQTIDWAGPTDFLRIKIDNPAAAGQAVPAFPLYLGETSHGERAVLIERIEMTAGPTGNRP